MIIDGVNSTLADSTFERPQKWQQVQEDPHSGRVMVDNASAPSGANRKGADHCASEV